MHIVFGNGKVGWERERYKERERRRENIEETGRRDSICEREGEEDMKKRVRHVNQLEKERKKEKERETKKEEREREKERIR